MSYADKDFWAAYRNYVARAKSRHSAAIDRLGGFLSPLLDLGCGRVQEGHELVIGKTPKFYRGVDLDPRPAEEGGPLGSTLKADYRTELELIKKWLTDAKFSPWMILSLFSIEPSGTPEENAQLYSQLFQKFPTVKRIISAGFYYEGKKTEPCVGEAGGLLSHQAIGPLISTSKIHEYRLLEAGPSDLFGPDVVEVWRLLERTK